MEGITLQRKILIITDNYYAGLAKVIENRISNTGFIEIVDMINQRTYGYGFNQPVTTSKTLLLLDCNYDLNYFTKRLKEEITSITNDFTGYPKHMWALGYRGSLNNPLKIVLPFTKFTYVVQNIKKFQYGDATLIQAINNANFLFKGNLAI